MRMLIPNRGRVSIESPFSMWPIKATAHLACMGVLIPWIILPTTQPKMAAFHDLGKSRVDKTVTELSQPATTVVFLPNFFRARSTTAPGCWGKSGFEPEGQNSVWVAPGQSAKIE